MEVMQLVQEREESSSENGSGDVWRLIWSLQAPSVLRIFCWKVSNNLLPNMVNLYRKKIVVIIHPNNTILSAFGSLEPNFQEVIHPGTTLAKARLTAKF